MTLAVRAMTQLAGWPDLTEAPASCGAGRALRSARGEIVHFHSDREVDLHLTASAIRRFTAEFLGSPAIRMVQGSPWVTIRLAGNADVDLLMTLVSLALKAHQTWPVPGDALQPPCNDHFRAAVPREDS
ncbi:luciferase family protein [Streptomyces sp. NPDC051172]|uniref:luciferase domain-containing protein n=1 Tax=Streptomyces sp. NPDC051172 TaxID=3155796 RepID=UPI00342E15DE